MKNRKRIMTSFRVSKLRQGHLQTTTVTLANVTLVNRQLHVSKLQTSHYMFSNQAGVIFKPQIANLQTKRIKSDSNLQKTKQNA